MKSTGHNAEIIQYVTKHPGCYMSDIRRDTAIQKGAIASALTELTRVKTLRREGFEKRYRYFVVRPEDRPATAPKRVPKQPNRDTANPLNNLFNQCLASVRGGRASA
nr:MAG TPA: winged helix-turn-helix domain protein [Caudoviricetes sp.]